MSNSYKSFKYIILGAGPAGLSFAHRLLDRGELSFLIIEQNEEAGGLCRSTQVDGSPLDLGGGHFLDSRREEVTNFLFRFLPKEEWTLFKRISTIQMNNVEIDYPFEANIWQFPIEAQIEYLISIAQAGCNIKNSIKPAKFIDWIRWKLGDKIADEYMIPYNRKIWSTDLNQLGTYWLHKLPDVSLKDSITSCLKKKASGKIPAHAHFYYPNKYGYGEVFKRIAAVFKDKILYNTAVNSVDFNQLIVNDQFRAETIITTIPWQTFLNSPTMDESVKEAIHHLERSSIDVHYYSQNTNSRAHWTYVPDENISYHRILHRHNFCKNSRGFWTETNSKRTQIDQNSSWSYHNEFAYPLNTIEKPKAMETILDWAKTKHVFGLGRWGEWEHHNSDVVIERAFQLADKITKNNFTINA